MRRGPRHFPASLAPVLAGLAALALYARTLPLGLTWANNGADGGDLLAAALTGGVPHPPGYPTYQLLLRLATSLVPGDPARSGAGLSAICAALAVALLADLGQRCAWRADSGRGWTASCAGFLSALAWAASPGLWGQATIVEVYALNALACVSLLWLAWRSVQAIEDARAPLLWVAAAGLVLGLALGNHLTVILMLPGLAIWWWLAGLSTRLRRADWIWAAIAFVAGLSVYLYLPLAARQRSPINWGDPATLGNLLWVVTARPYAGLAFGLPLQSLGARMLGWATWTTSQFMPWGLVLALVGLWRLDVRGRADRLVRAWWFATLVTWLAFTIYAIGYNTTDSLAYLLPAFAVMALWLAEALHWAIRSLGGRRRLQAGFAVLALAVVVALPVASNWQRQDLSRDAQARQFISAALSEAGKNGVILASGDRRTFALWYAVYGLRQRPDVLVLNVNLYAYEWYRRSLAERAPDLLSSVDAPPPIESLIAVLSAKRPVYAAETLGSGPPVMARPPGDVLTLISSP